MQLNEVKARVQAEALDKVRQANGGLVAIATGGGKSKIAIDYAMEIVEAKPDARIQIIVPTRVLRDTDWKDEFYKWGAGGIWETNVRKECYVYVHKIENEVFDLIIMDEVQHITELNFKFFEQNRISKTIALSATPPKEKEKRELLEVLRIRTVYHLPLDEAVEIGLVAPYKLTLIESTLNNTSQHVEAGGRNRKWMTTENRHYDYLTGDIGRARARGERNDRMKWKYFNRMRFIYNLKSKEAIAKYVLENMIPQDERTLIFTGSIAMAEELEPNTYHSKTTDTKLTEFRNMEINRLSCVNALNEGVNIPKVDNALIVQVNSKERHLIQKIGRILRFEEGHVGHIYLMYVKGTVDEKWMEEATLSLDKSHITRIRMNT